MKVMLPVLLLTSGCMAADVGAYLGAITVLHRSPTDVLISAVVGRDCSSVHLDAGKPYCTPRERPPEEPLFCTGSLGVPDCWSEPSKLPNAPREIADGPRSLTPEQEAERVKRWPGLW